MTIILSSDKPASCKFYLQFVEWPKKLKRYFLLVTSFFGKSTQMEYFWSSATDQPTSEQALIFFDSETALPWHWHNQTSHVALKVYHFAYFATSATWIIWAYSKISLLTQLLQSVLQETLINPKPFGYKYRHFICFYKAEALCSQE